ncbi:MAG: SMP-30/gluconolactonase/LRE family protein [Cyclobacteriaceae bacterium]
MKPTFFSFLLLLSIFSQSQPDQRVNNSTIAFTIPEKDLLPESIAYDPVEDAFYLSSTRKGKILKRSTDGSLSDFATVDDGLWMTIGIKVDENKRHLWVCSSGGGNLVGYEREESRPAGIFKFDLETGDLLWKHTIDESDENHFFNDLVVAKNGEIYATHMFDEASIYKIRGKQVQSAFSKEVTMKYPNGLTLSPDEQYLFVAHSGGIGRIETSTGNWLNISSDKTISGNDGLYFYKNSLLGVMQDERSVRRYFLDEKMEKIIRIEVLEKNHPMMIVPTTGVLVGNELFYIANAQFESFNEDGSLWPMDRLYEPVVLKVKID